jgi:hypothetical protein
MKCKKDTLYEELFIRKVCLLSFEYGESAATTRGLFCVNPTNVRPDRLRVSESDD